MMVSVSRLRLLLTVLMVVKFMGWAVLRMW